MPGATALVIANDSEAIQKKTLSNNDNPENIEKRHVAAKQLKLIKEKFDKAAAWAFGKGKKTITIEDLRAPEVRPLIHVINNALLGGVNPHISQTMPPEMARKLKEDVFIFSGAKTYAELKQVGDLLTNDKGFVKPFDEFTRDVQRVHETYNLNYLQAEYIYATQSAQMASNWQQIEEDGDRYLLQYRTVGDDRVRYEHQLLDGITLPPSDPFWAEYYPPNGWRCRCTAVQVLKTSYDKTDPKQAMELGKGAIKDRDKIFRMNPGKQAVIFPEKHPYYNVLGKEGKDVVKEILVGETKEKELTPEQKAEADKKRDEIMKFADNEIIGKYFFQHEKFKAKFVKKSFAENLTSFSLLDGKIDVLRNIKQYLSDASDYSFEPNFKIKKKPQVLGYHCLIGVYDGSIEELVGRKILFKFEVNTSEGKNDDAKFYFIKFI